MHSNSQAELPSFWKQYTAGTVEYVTNCRYVDLASQVDFTGKQQGLRWCQPSAIPWHPLHSRKSTCLCSGNCKSARCSLGSPHTHTHQTNGTRTWLEPPLPTGDEPRDAPRDSGPGAGCCQWRPFLTLLAPGYRELCCLHHRRITAAPTEKPKKPLQKTGRHRPLVRNIQQPSVRGSLQLLPAGFMRKPANPLGMRATSGRGSRAAVRADCSPHRSSSAVSSHSSLSTRSSEWRLCSCHPGCPTGSLSMEEPDL